MTKFSPLFGIPAYQSSSQEITILEIEFFIRIYEELMKFYAVEYEKYFFLIKQEYVMCEAMVLRLVINDIIKSQEYSLQGIVYETQIPEEVICDLLIGENKSPSLYVSRKLIKLHRSIRPKFYDEIMKKIK